MRALILAVALTIAAAAPVAAADNGKCRGEVLTARMIAALVLLELRTGEQHAWVCVHGRGGGWQLR